MLECAHRHSLHHRFLPISFAEPPGPFFKDPHNNLSSFFLSSFGKMRKLEVFCLNVIGAQIRKSFISERDYIISSITIITQMLFSSIAYYTYLPLAANCEIALALLFASHHHSVLWGCVINIIGVEYFTRLSLSKLVVCASRALDGVWA